MSVWSWHSLPWHLFWTTAISEFSIWYLPTVSTKGKGLWFLVAKLSQSEIFSNLSLFLVTHYFLLWKVSTVYFKLSEQGLIDRSVHSTGVKNWKQKLKGKFETFWKNLSMLKNLYRVNILLPIPLLQSYLNKLQNSRETFTWCSLLTT